MKYATLHVESRGAHVLLVTLERPQALNALNTQMGSDLYDLWTRLAAEPVSYTHLTLPTTPYV